MRLNEIEKEIIVTTIEKIFGEVKVFLFGSRMIKDKKGGDIDLFVIAAQKSNLFEKKIRALAKLERILHKPIDIVVHRNFQREIEKEILKQNIALN